MEKITINEINKKDSGLVIVKYSKDMEGNHEATMNTKWQAQEVDYFEKDVGIGGSVSVLIQQKGDYTNITKVDFTSAVKGEQIDIGPMIAEHVKVCQGKGEPSRDDRICAQWMTGRATEILIAKYDLTHMTLMQISEAMSEIIPEVHGAMELALDRLR